MFAVFIVCFFIILLVQMDFGSAMIFLLITAFCCLIPKHPGFKTMQILVVIGIILFILLMFYGLTEDGIKLLSNFPALSHQITRFKAAADPFLNRYGTGYYDLVNSLIAFNTGGLKGVGLGRSLRKYGYISAADTDFIMAVIVEELGIGGFLFVFVGYAALIGIIWYYALKMKDERSKITLIGIAMYFMLYFIFNIGGVTCFLPLTGIPLLLISKGGSSTLSCMIAIGIVQALIVKEKESPEGFQQ